MHELEHKIRTRAYEIWEREGRSGDAEAHWYEAEVDVRAALTSALDLDGALAEPATPKSRRRAKAAAPEAAPAARVETGRKAAPRRKAKTSEA